MNRVLLGIAKEITVRCPLAPAGRGQGEGMEKIAVISFAILGMLLVVSSVTVACADPPDDEVVVVKDIAYYGDQAPDDYARSLQTRRLVSEEPAPHSRPSSGFTVVV